MVCLAVKIASHLRKTLCSLAGCTLWRHLLLAVLSNVFCELRLALLQDLGLPVNSPLRLEGVMIIEAPRAPVAATVPAVDLQKVD